MRRFLSIIFSLTIFLSFSGIASAEIASEPVAPTAPQAPKLNNVSGNQDKNIPFLNNRRNQAEVRLFATFHTETGNHRYQGTFNLCKIGEVGDSLDSQLIFPTGDCQLLKTNRGGFAKALVVPGKYQIWPPDPCGWGGICLHSETNMHPIDPELVLPIYRWIINPNPFITRAGDRINISADGWFASFFPKNGN